MMLNTLDFDKTLNDCHTTRFKAIIQVVKIQRLHDWNISPAEAIALQQDLAKSVMRTGKVINPCFIAGVDLAIARPRGKAKAAVVIVRYPEFEPVETKIIEGIVDFPYVPGLLSFREAPLALEAFAELSIVPDLVLVDGQGIAHPRRIGIAAHLGLILDIPTIGCAKSRLCGESEPPGDEAGYWTSLIDKGEIIGATLRSRHGTKPVFVSIGHKIDLENTIFWVLKCCRGYRIPEPLRLAHLAAGAELIQAGKI